MSSGVTVGSDARGDCRIAVTPAESLRIEIKTKAQSLVAPGIQTVVENALARYGSPALAVTVEDAGSFDYVLAARTETAIRMLPTPGTASQVPAIRRAPSEFDRPRRSRLYAPGNNPRLLAGIEVHGADCVLLDLEDSVPISEKMAARILVKHLLSAIAFPEEVWVRINGLDQGGEDDVREVLQGSPHGICLPKAESADDVTRASTLLSEIEGDCGIEAGFTKIMPIIETARGVLHCEEIAAADPRVVMLAFGAEDFTRDVGALRSRRSMLFARSMIVAAATATGIQSSDTVFADLGDMDGFGKECALARELGFDGKGAINPRQLAPIHQSFSPSDDALAYARRVVAAAEDAEKAGSGAVALDGKMIDRPVLERAKRTLKYGEQLTRRGM
ncbi:aldolase/citrate lyase family protein [Candidatus Bipolaricaulota bacterium]